MTRTRTFPWQAVKQEKKGQLAHVHTMHPEKKANAPFHGGCLARTRFDAKANS